MGFEWFDETTPGGWRNMGWRLRPEKVGIALRSSDLVILIDFIAGRVNPAQIHTAATVTMLLSREGLLTKGMMN